MKGDYNRRFKGQLKDCDRCGFTFHIKELTRIGGKYLDKKCIDKDERG